MMLNINYSIHALVDTIVAILNVRDPYTFEHSMRVSALSEHIVSKMNICTEWADAIHMAAHLHDIGKIGVPDYILNKPGKLTKSEYEKMKEHPEIGYGIVSAIENLEKIALYVRHHHERWDGGGYPCGLRGKDIPLGARIIAITDSFDAITSSRPYHCNKSLDSAFEEIEIFAGTQFCPEVSHIFLELKDEIPSILEEVNQTILNKKTYCVTAEKNLLTRPSVSNLACQVK